MIGCGFYNIDKIININNDKIINIIYVTSYQNCTKYLNDLNVFDKF